MKSFALFPDESFVPNRKLSPNVCHVPKFEQDPKVAIRKKNAAEYPKRRTEIGTKSAHINKQRKSPDEQRDFQRPKKAARVQPRAFAVHHNKADRADDGDKES